MTTLAKYALEVESVCDEIDDLTEQGKDIPRDLIKRFDGANELLALKTDRWIGFLDAVAARLDLLREQKRRIKKAISAGEAMQTRLKDYVKFVLLEFAEQNGKRLPFVGTEGQRLCLHNNPKSLQIDLKTENKMVYGCVDKNTILGESSLNGYLKVVPLYVIDKEKLKADIEAGKEVSWARIVQEAHVRIR